MILGVVLAFTVFSTAVLLDRTPVRGRGVWWPVMARKKGVAAGLMSPAVHLRFALHSREAALVREGLRLLNAGNERGALEVFRALLDADPTRVELLPAVGLLSARLGRDRDAERYLLRYVHGKGRRDPQAYALLGIVQLRRREYNAAVQNLATALNSLPRDAYLHCAIAAAYAQAGAEENAIAHLHEAWELAGAHILPLLDEPDFDRIRRRPDFQSLMKRAEPPAHARPPHDQTADPSPRTIGKSP